MSDIITVTLNPAVDYSTEVAACTPGPKLRCAAPTIHPGGGGINVSRAIRILGGGSLALFAGGGPNGTEISDLLTTEGLSHECYQISGNTRHSLAVMDQKIGKQFRFVLPGPVWTAQMQTEIIEQIRGRLRPDTIVVLSGSQPPGVSVDFPRQLSNSMASGDARLFVDTSGPALDALFKSGPNPPSLIRMNQTEAENLAQRKFENPQQLADFCQQMIVDNIAENLVIAHGSSSIFASKSERLICYAPDVEIASKVGAGDSFVGAFTFAIASNETAEFALKRGAAAASAACMTDATELCRRTDVDTLFDQCIVEMI